MSCELVSGRGRDARVLLWAGPKLLHEYVVASDAEALLVAAQQKIEFGATSTS
jgi:hypothetical protein